jgi:hypothetical protein
VGTLRRACVAWVELCLHAGFAARGIRIDVPALILRVDVHRACGGRVLKLERLSSPRIERRIWADHDRTRHALYVIPLPVMWRITNVDGSSAACANDVVHVAVWRLTPSALHVPPLMRCATYALASRVRRSGVLVALRQRVGRQCGQDGILRVLHGRLHIVASLRGRWIIRHRLKLGMRNRL